MTNIEFFVLLGTVLAGVFWQKADTHHLSGRIDQLTGRVDQLSGRMDQMFDQLSGRVDRISDDLRQFYRELGRHDKAIESLERKQ